MQLRVFVIERQKHRDEVFIIDSSTGKASLARCMFRALYIFTVVTRTLKHVVADSFEPTYSTEVIKYPSQVKLCIKLLINILRS